MEPKNLPKHIALIPDGNRRWAKEKGLPDLMGHREGVKRLEELINACKDLGVKYFSTWAFSTENWKRSDEEKEYLFNLIRELVDNYKQKFLKENIRFIHLGRKDRLADDIVKSLIDFEESTKNNTALTVSIGLDYGGHDEIVRAVQKLIASGAEITEEAIEANLDSKDIPPPDLIIRTSGELRLSGYMSWQSAYAEYYFPKVHFPQFGKEQLIDAIKDFENRDRRFGGNSSNKDKITFG